MTKNMAMNLPGLISVAMATYNGERFIEDQLSSVLGQRDVLLELVISDDCSTDATWCKLQSWAARDDRIRLSQNDTQLGFTANFALAISRCRGEYIAPCDQDDIWKTNKLAQLLSTMNGHMLNYCDSELVDESGKTMGRRMSDRVNMYHGSGIVPLAFWNSVSGHAMLFRSELLQYAWPFPSDGFHDWWLAVVASNMGSIGYLDKPLVAYRQHRLSLTDVTQRKGDMRDSWAIYQRRGRWFQSLATLSGPDQIWCRRLASLWSDRECQWICPALYSHLSERASELMRLNQRESFTRFALKQFMGQRWRR